MNSEPLLLRQRPARRGFFCFAAVFSCATLLAPPAQAAFHLWQIREIYSNASGTLQFVELFCPSASQTALNSLQITASTTFTLNHGISGDSLNHALLFGTAGLQAAGGPAPDYIIPNNFLATPNGSISFFGANSGSYTALPLDGINSKIWGDGNSVNNPQNYAGQVGLVTVPEPATWALFALGGIAIGALLRRRSRLV